SQYISEPESRNRARAYSAHGRREKAVPGRERKSKEHRKGENRSEPGKARTKRLRERLRRATLGSQRARQPSQNYGNGRANDGDRHEYDLESPAVNKPLGQHGPNAHHDEARQPVIAHHASAQMQRNRLDQLHQSSGENHSSSRRMKDAREQDQRGNRKPRGLKKIPHYSVLSAVCIRRIRHEFSRRSGAATKKISPRRHEDARKSFAILRVFASSW